jgi:hypothetical protein
MARKPENKALDILLVNALARHRILSRKTCATMFPGIETKKIYERLYYLLKKGVIMGMIHHQK